LRGTKSRSNLIKKIKLNNLWRIWA